jgi:hypothetical protein
MLLTKPLCCTLAPGGAGLAKVVTLLVLY